MTKKETSTSKQGTKIISDIKTFGKFRLEYNSPAKPIGSERGKVVTMGLADGLPLFNVKQYFGSQPTIFNDYDHVVTGYDIESNKAISLIGARWLGAGEVRFLYLWTAMVADNHRATMLFSRSLAYFFHMVASEATDHKLPSLIVTKTYNPVVYYILNSFAKAGKGIDIYPQIPAQQQSASMMALAGQIANAISTKLVLIKTTGVVLGGQAMVAPDFFPYMEESKTPEINNHFKQHVSRADQILCVLRIPEAENDALFSAVTASLNAHYIN